MLEVIKNKAVYFNDYKLPIGANFSSFDIQKLKGMLELAKKIVQMLDLLNCSGDLEISKLTEADWENIKMLITAFVDKKTVKGLKSNLDYIQRVNIQDYVFLLVFWPNKDNNTYTILDFFKTELNVSYLDKNGAHKPISQYSYLKFDDIMQINNTRFDVILPSFQKNKNDPVTYEGANTFLLELLLAYDKGHEKKDEILKVAKEISKWILDNADDEILCYPIRLLNHLQVIRRERQLNTDEIRQLYKIIEQPSLEEEILVGAHLLLNNQVAVQMYFEKLDEKSKLEFEKYPIFKFYKKFSPDDGTQDNK